MARSFSTHGSKPDCFYDIDNGKYYVALDPSTLEKRRNRRWIPLDVSVGASGPSGEVPPKGDVATQTGPSPPASMGLLEDEGSHSGPNESDQEGSTTSHEGDSELAQEMCHSPQDFYQPGPASPTDNARFFGEHFIKMANALELDFTRLEEDAADPIERRIQGTAPKLAAIPFLPSLEKIAKRSWETPASFPSTSRKIDDLYRIAPSSASWLHSHPVQNSAIVESSQRIFTPRTSTSPMDREAKKLDGLAKKSFEASALGLRVANYNACMGAYVQYLMERLSPLLAELPDDNLPVATQLIEETHAVGGLLITSARHSTDCSAKSMAAAIALRRHAWLRASDLTSNAKTAIEDMPFDTEGLFNKETDERLNNKYKMKSTAKKHGMSLAQQAFSRRRFGGQRSFFGQGQRPFSQDRQPEQPSSFSGRRQQPRYRRPLAKRQEANTSMKRQ